MFPICLRSENIYQLADYHLIIICYIYDCQLPAPDTHTLRHTSVILLLSTQVLSAFRQPCIYLTQHFPTFLQLHVVSLVSKIRRMDMHHLQASLRKGIFLNLPLLSGCNRW